MKIPKTPPNRRNVFFDLFDSSMTANHLESVALPTVGGRYVHWEKLQYLTPPKGITHKQWWALLKFRRSVVLRTLALRSVDGRCFQFCVPDFASELLHGLDRDAAGVLMVSEQVTTPESRDRYIVSSLMEEAITSSQLEGAATTRAIAREMLRSGRTPTDHSERMIANNYAAMRRIRELHGQPLTPEFVLDLHRILTQDAIDDSSAVGRFRRSEETVCVYDNYNQVLHNPPPATELAHRLEAMCAFANKQTPDFFVHPVIRAIILHFWLAYDHPFVDGNGRCARALFYWSMLNSGYWLCEFISISQTIRQARVRYGRAFLYTETDDNDLTYFIAYHLEVIRKAIDSLQTYLAEKQLEVARTERLLHADENLNYRQLALLGHALRHPEGHYTVASHRASHNVAYETARKDLMRLQEAGFLFSRKRGQALHFYPVADLHHRLRPNQTTIKKEAV